MASVSPRVVVGLTGGIAAFKVVSVIRGLVEKGCDVHVVPSESALKFIGTATLEAISGNPVRIELFDGVSEVRHVALGQSADVILIAPATANTLSQLAHGRADNLLLTTVLASSAPIVVAPAMHTEMWENAATDQNVDTLIERGFHFVGPARGRLTGADSGIGRLVDVDEIIDAVMGQLSPQDYDGLSVVVTAGGTREPIDPVRFIGNRSTGEMGVRIAQEAQRRGARVTLIAAHLEVDTPRGVSVVQVSTAEEMRVAVMREAPTADVFIAAAAVGDYRVESVSDAKLKKSNGTPDIRLIENRDILAEFCESYHATYVVGFAAETSDIDLHATLEGKARAKGVDMIVGNTVGAESGFGNVSTDIVLLATDGSATRDFKGTKAAAATFILDNVSRQRDKRQ